MQARRRGWGRKPFFPLASESEDCLPMLIIKSSDVVAAAGRAGPSSDRSRRHHLLGRVSAPTSCIGTPV